jgi:5-oxoprolinase (ATP-hydrolysing)
VLGRLVPSIFPKIFGPKQNEALDVETTRAKMNEMKSQIYQESGTDLSLDEIAYGFIKVANETMCRPIRSLTQAKGFDTKKHVLSSFGGAGGQHACAIAKSLGISKVFIHR